jgi:hypothetical protein
MRADDFEKHEISAARKIVSKPSHILAACLWESLIFTDCIVDVIARQGRPSEMDN